MKGEAVAEKLSGRGYIFLHTVLSELNVDYVGTAFEPPTASPFRAGGVGFRRSLKMWSTLTNACLLSARGLTLLVDAAAASFINPGAIMLTLDSLRFG